MNNGQARQDDYPRNTWQLIKYIAKRIPERLLKALPMTIGMGLLFWLLHTFLLVYTNEGFNPDTWLGQNILNVRGRLISSTLLWMMLGAVVPMIISFIKKKQSPAKMIREAVGMPGRILKTNRESGGKFLPVMCFSCAAALLLEGLLSGLTSLVMGGIVMSSVIAFLTGRGSIFIQILRMVFQDVQLFILKKQKLGLDGNNVLMIVGVSGVTLFAVGLLKSLLYRSVIIMAVISWLWVVAVILGIVFVYSKKNIPKQFVLLLGFFGMSAVLASLAVTGVYADDGGWAEAGGTFSSWISSEGAGQAIFMGLPPTIGGLVGSYVSSILTGLFEGFTVPVADVPIAPQVPPAVPAAGPGAAVQGDTSGADVSAKQKDEEERIRKETEAAQREFERQRQLKIKEQEELRRKALDDLKKAEQMRKEKQAYIDRLCKKYNCQPDQLKRRIKQGMIDAMADEADAWNQCDKEIARLEAAAKITLVAADTAIDGLANATGPLGRGIRAGYKVAKGIGTAYGEEGELSGKAILTGAVKGGADAATDYMKTNTAKNITSFTGEVVGGYISDGGKGAWDGAKGATLNILTGTVTDKITGKMGGGDYGNMMDPVNFNKDGTATITMLSNETGKWVTKNVSGKVAIQFMDKKIKQQTISSAGKGANGLLNELVIKPALGMN